ncbi:hypothetical protein QBC47DRAFT_356972 [Echria macrotheca]|uniref:Uncharacterized protein n=1 Tax=Echria macrotheca TaxID=438768 RepID=A0AAJ0BKW6_9PEZI|nr:hypothetical protein QBC47DRAFT_356972 [Echria macrotheca]
MYLPYSHNALAYQYVSPPHSHRNRMGPGNTSLKEVEHIELGSKVSPWFLHARKFKVAKPSDLLPVTNVDGAFDLRTAEQNPRREGKLGLEVFDTRQAKDGTYTLTLPTAANTGWLNFKIDASNVAVNLLDLQVTVDKISDLTCECSSCETWPRDLGLSGMIPMAFWIGTFG